MAYGFNEDKSKYPLEEVIESGSSISLAVGDHTGDPLDVTLPEGLDDYPAYTIELLLDPETGEKLYFHKGDEGIPKEFSIGEDVTGTATLGNDGTLSFTWNNAGESAAPIGMDVIAYPYPALRDIIYTGQSSGGGGGEFDRKYLGKNWVVDTGDRYLVVIGGGEEGSPFDVLEIEKTTGHINHRSLSSATRQSANPSSNVVIGGEIFYDANGEQIGYNQIVKNSTGQIYRSYAVQNEKANGDPVTAALYLYANKDGTTSMSLNSGTKLNVQYISGLGSLATKNNVTVPAHAFSSKNVTVTKTLSIAANSYKSFEINVSAPSGYSLASLMQVTTNHPGYCTIAGFDVDTGKVLAHIYNHSAATRSVQVTAQVHYLQSAARTAS